jgi:hypothetical protein
MEEIDIWRSANKLIELYGDEAISYAVKRSLQLTDDGDDLGAHVMKRVAEAIEILQRPDSEGLQVH